MKQLAKYLSDFSESQMMQSDTNASDFTLRASPAASAPITIDERDSLLAKCASGEYVELFIDYVAFEQRAGRSNRRFVRFADSMMEAFAASGVQSVFIVDHSQDSVLARGGTVIESKLVVVGKAQRIMQTAKLTAPEFVALALRGLIDRYSIGWAGDPPTCSICAGEIYSCEHYPGQSYLMPGEKKKTEPCERIYSKAVLIETSGCNVPAVPETVGIRIRSAPTDQQNSGLEPQQRDNRKMEKKLLEALGLADGASEKEQHEAIAALAVEAKRLKSAAAASDAAAAASDAAAAASDAAATLAVVDAAKLKAAAANSRIDAMIDGAIKSGKLAAGGDAERILRELGAHSADAIEALLAASPAATLAGAPDQFSAAARDAKPKLSPDEINQSEASEIIAALAAHTKISAAAYVDNVVKALNLDSIEKLRSHGLMVLTKT